MLTIRKAAQTVTTILVVDDSRFSRSRLIAALDTLGHRLIEAGDGLDGLLAVDLYSPDLVVTDLIMPVLDGFGFLRGLQARHSRIPVIVVSAEIQPASRKLCCELGAAAFVSKPFHANELAAQARQLLGQQSLVTH